jgi:pimeloyl-ACP methyl ester carboxylesterase
MKQTRNPSFPATLAEARCDLKRMRAEPRALERPLVVLGGYLELGLSQAVLKARFHRLTGDDRIAGVPFTLCKSFDGCRRRAIAAVERAFPGPDPLRTTEVDVVGISMGGIVARYAALSPERADARRLRIARLFTIASPHLGADRARLPAVNQLQRDMRADSAFIRRLNRPENAPDYPVFPYVRLGDLTVGAANAAPTGMTAWWVPDVALQPPHSGAMVDARIIADIARRLRGEKPFTTLPAAPLPTAAGRDQS